MITVENKKDRARQYLAHTTDTAGDGGVRGGRGLHGNRRIPVDLREDFIVSHVDREDLQARVDRPAGHRKKQRRTTEAGTELNNQRRLQLVSPWSAAISPGGVFGIPLIGEIAYSGLAILTLDIIPAPEPALGVGLAIGSAAGFGLLRRRRARRPDRVDRA